MAAMAPIIALGVAGEEATHKGGEPGGTTAEQEVGMVRQERPGIEWSAELLDELAQSGDKLVAVFVVGHDHTLFNAADDDVV